MIEPRRRDHPPAVVRQVARKAASVLHQEGVLANRGFLLLSAALMGLCALHFVYDLARELHGHFVAGSGFTRDEIIQLVFDVISICGYALGPLLVSRQLRLIEATRRSDKELIALFRGQFDEAVNRAFDRWGLTPAERDVALLTLRGLSGPDIAGARKTSPGTVKLQMHAIFRKSGLGSRAELMSLFLDEFLETGASVDRGESGTEAASAA